VEAGICLPYARLPAGIKGTVSQRRGEGGEEKEDRGRREEKGRRKLHGTGPPIG